MANKTENRVASVGSRYKNTETGDFVNVFFVEPARDEVRFSKEGPGSGQEFSLNNEEFLRTHEDAPIDPNATQKSAR